MKIGLIHSYQGRSQKNVVGILRSVAYELQWNIPSMTDWIDHGDVASEPATLNPQAAEIKKSAKLCDNRCVDELLVKGQITRRFSV